MHRLQQHILNELMRHSTRRYADLKPHEVEGNLFMYHLRHLMNDGLVAKRTDGLYELSPEGQRFADGFSLKEFAPRAQPRIVTLIVCHNEAGEYLFWRRKRQPMIGWAGFPYGKIHLGETIATAAQRELHEKTGLEAKLSHRGDGYVSIYQAGEPVSQIMFHLFYGQNPTGKLHKESKDGSAFWSRPDAVKGNVLPSVADLLKLVSDNSGHFFQEFTYHLPE
jgi:8-oxo-dGTP diphosphatase